MKIGIVHSGYEMLSLMQILNQYDHEYHLFCDWSCQPWGDKTNNLRKKRIQVGCDYLRKQGVDIVIVPPLAEVSMSSDLGIPVLPLFSTYIHTYVLRYSLVGKIGLLCDNADLSEAESILREVIMSYELSDTQEATKSFHTDFPLRLRAVPMWKHFMTTYGRRDWMVRKSIKHDLRYFRNADVDTLVPLDRGMLFREKIIVQHTNWKKIRFHGADAVNICFQQLTRTLALTSSEYHVTLHCTDLPQKILDEKKWMQILERGDTQSMKIVQIS